MDMGTIIMHIYLRITTVSPSMTSSIRDCRESIDGLPTYRTPFFSSFFYSPLHRDGSWNRAEYYSSFRYTSHFFLSSHFIFCAIIPHSSSWFPHHSYPVIWSLSISSLLLSCPLSYLVSPPLLSQTCATILFALFCPTTVTTSLVRHSVLFTLFIISSLSPFSLEPYAVISAIIVPSS